MLSIETVSSGKVVEAAKLLQRCFELKLHGVDFIVQHNIQDLAKAYNGIGPEWMPKELRKAIDALSPELKPAAFIHDARFTFSDGSREQFNVANDELEANGILIAKARFKWWDIRRYTTKYKAKAYAELCRKFGWEAYKRGCTKHNALNAAI